MPSHSKNIWCLSYVDIFQDLSAQEADHLCKIATSRTYKKGSYLFMGHDDMTDTIFLVERGKVNVYESTFEGKKIIIEQLSRGDFWGYLFQSTKASNLISHFAQAHSDALVSRMSRTDFLAFLKSRPDVSLRLIQNLSEKLMIAESRIKDLALASADQRLVRELIRLSTQHGKTRGEKITIEARLTHEQLADRIGMTRETVTRTLNQLKKNKIISINKARYITVDTNRAKSLLKS